MCYAGYAMHSNSAASLSHRHSTKKPTMKKPYQETPFKKWFLMDFRKLFRIRIGCVEKCVKYVKKIRTLQMP